MKKTNAICGTCETKFYRSPSGLGKNNYCSHDCYGKALKGILRTADKYCKYCGGNITGHQKHKKDTKYCSQSCYFRANTKPFIIKKGYKKLLIPYHSRADTKGYVFEHIVVIESILNRQLRPNEELHHIDKNPLNNSPDNLRVYKNHRDHMMTHKANS